MIKCINAKYDFINRNYLIKLEDIIEDTSNFVNNWYCRIKLDFVPADVVHETGSAGTIGDTD